MQTEFQFLDRKNRSTKTSLTKLLIRDSSLLVIGIVLVIIQPENLFAQYLLGTLLGVIFYLSHEWAHLGGALLSKSIVAYPEKVLSPFIFSFHSQANSVRQFLLMTAGGFGATAVLLSAYLICLPDNVWGSVALYISLFLTSLTVFIELPIAIWTLISREVAPVEIPFISRNPLVEKISGGLANMRRKIGSDPRD